jgi:hypothetical protein
MINFILPAEEIVFGGLAVPASGYIFRWWLTDWLTGINVGYDQRTGRWENIDLGGKRVNFTLWVQNTGDEPGFIFGDVKGLTDTWWKRLDPDERPVGFGWTVTLPAGSFSYTIEAGHYTKLVGENPTDGVVDDRLYMGWGDKSKVFEVSETPLIILGGMVFPILQRPTPLLNALRGRPILQQPLFRRLNSQGLRRSRLYQDNG